MSFASLRRQMDDLVDQMMMTHPQRSSFFFDPGFISDVGSDDLLLCATCAPGGQQQQLSQQQQQQLQQQQQQQQLTGGTGGGRASTSSSDQQQLQPLGAGGQINQRQFFGLAPVRADVAEDPKSFTVTAELPGVSKENVNVTIENGFLVLSGDKKEEKVDEKDQGGRRIRRQERRYGQFTRSFKLPQSCETDKVTANYNNGILTINLPKSPEKELSQKQKIAIQ